MFTDEQIAAIQETIREVSAVFADYFGSFILAMERVAAAMEAGVVQTHKQMQFVEQQRQQQAAPPDQPPPSAGFLPPEEQWRAK